MLTRPSGTVTFLFTDVDATIPAHQPGNPTAVQDGLARCDEVLRQAVESRGGYAYKKIGPAAYQIAFSTAPQALTAASASMHALYAEERASGLRLPPVRMALHTGVTEERDGDYVGPLLNRVARLLAVCHGGQTLLTLATEELVRDALPEGISLRGLGEHRLRDLTRPELIFQLVVPELPSDFPPLKTLESRPNNLPLQPTTLIGREREIASAVELLLRDDVWLLTLTGPAGTGKTRLGLQVASELLDDFADGVFFVPLASITDPDLVVSAIAHTLGIREVGGQSLVESLKAGLRDKQLLLLLDNFEQVLDATPLVADLLDACPRLKVLVTSRMRLRLSAEHELPVPPLSLPDLDNLPAVESLTQYDAVSLFAARAQTVNPTFQLTSENALPIAEICHRLDGLPLAIELAAARARILSPQELLARLDNALKLLTGGGRDLPARQQTLRGTIDWSYNLLQEEEKSLFARLSVFVGGCTLEAAEAVVSGQTARSGDRSAPIASPTTDHRRPTTDVLDVIGSLVEKNLLRQEDVGGVADEPRFRMLQTIREYALERLEENREREISSQRHAEFFAAWVGEAEPHLRGPHQSEWLARLGVDHDNLRAALRWTRERGDIETGLRLSGVLWRFWDIRGLLTEGRAELEAVLAVDADITRSAIQATRAKVLRGAGVLAWSQADYDAARSLLKESLELYRALGDKPGIADVLITMGNAAKRQGDYAAARSLHEESLALHRELGDKWGIATALNNLGIVVNEQGDYAAARSLYEESLALRRELGDKRTIATSLTNLAAVAQHDKDYAAARALNEESLTIFRELGDKRGVAVLLNNMGDMAEDQGDYASAGPLYKESLVLRQELGDKRGIAYGLEGLARVTLRIPPSQGNIERAARLWGAAEALRDSTNSPLSPVERADHDRDVAAARAQVDERAFQSAWDEGRAMSLEQAIAYALSETPLEVPSAGT